MDFTPEDIIKANPVVEQPLTVLDVIVNEYPGMFYSLDADYAIHRGWGSLKRAVERGETDPNERVRQTDFKAMQRAGRQKPWIPGWGS